MAASGKYRNVICHYFNSPEGCWHGINCYYKHAKYEKPAPCRFYGTERGCRYGNRCFYSHIPPLTNLGSNPSNSVGSSYSYQEPDLEVGRVAEVPSLDSAGSCAWSSGCEDHLRAGIGHCGQTPPPWKTVFGAGCGVDLLSPTIAGMPPTPEKSGLEMVPEEGPELLKSSTPQKDREENEDTAEQEQEETEEPLKNRKSSKTKVSKMKCGWCPTIVSSRRMHKALGAHYAQELLKLNPAHTRYFKQNYSFFDDSLTCGTCDKTYETITDFLKHIKSKLEDKRRSQDSKVHKQILDILVIPFVENDLGELEDEDLRNRLMLMLLSRYVYGDEGSSDFLPWLKGINKLKGEPLVRKMEEHSMSFEDLLMFFSFLANHDEDEQDEEQQDMLFSILANEIDDEDDYDEEQHNKKRRPVVTADGIIHLTAGEEEELSMQFIFPHKEKTSFIRSALRALDEQYF